MKRVHADENAEDTRIARLVDTLAMASGADGNRALPSTIALPVDAASGVSERLLTLAKRTLSLQTAVHQMDTTAEPVKVGNAEALRTSDIATDPKLPLRRQHVEMPLWRQTAHATRHATERAAETIEQRKRQRTSQSGRKGEHLAEEDDDDDADEEEGSNRGAPESFHALYMSDVTRAFADDLDAVRSDPLFTMESVASLLDALQAGMRMWSEDDRRLWLQM